MAQRHWLDPLARQLLIASGQLPRPSRPSPALPPLAGWWRASRTPQPQGAESPAGGGAEDEDEEGQRQEAIERDLLALQLAREPGRPLRDAAEVRRAAQLGWRLDVNRATAADWRRLPGCSQAHADLLQRLQAGGVQLSGPEDLQRLLGLAPALLESWLPLLEFRWYGAPPEDPGPTLAVNGAPPAELLRLGGLAEGQLDQLLRERGRRPFRDLADLQERLGLPASVVESWIGRVSFEPPPPGPRLPPAPPPRR